MNRIVFHRYQHQPWLDRRPGMTMGPYGVHWERTQTWWDMVRRYHDYLARCQFMLRQGLPVADVCYLAAGGRAARVPAARLGPARRAARPARLQLRRLRAGDAALRGGVTDGRLAFADGMSYGVLVLPERETMTPALLRKVRELVEAGATVIGPPPRKSPSLSGYPACDAEVAALAAELWGDCDGERVGEHAYGKGRFIWEKMKAAGAVPTPDQPPLFLRHPIPAPFRPRTRPGRSAPRRSTSPSNTGITLSLPAFWSR